MAMRVREDVDGMELSGENERPVTQANARTRKGAPQDALHAKTPMPAGSAFRELEAASCLGLAVFLALDDAAVAGQEALRLQGGTKPRLVIEQRLADAVAHRARLAREPAAGDGAVHVELAEAIDDDEGLVEQHAQHGAREINRAVAAVHRDLAGAGRDPDPRDGVLALAGRIGAALGVELRLAFGSRCRARRGLRRMTELRALKGVAQSAEILRLIGHG